MTGSKVSPMDNAPVTLFVCVSCREADTNPEIRPGRLLMDRIAAALEATSETRLVAKSVECLSVCKRPCTIALAAESKWTYVIGDLSRDVHVDEIIAAALRYRESETGIVPWRERPQSFRKGVVARIPPLNK